jgi:hypothetical protein
MVSGTAVVLGWNSVYGGWNSLLPISAVYEKPSRPS